MLFASPLLAVTSVPEALKLMTDRSGSWIAFKARVEYKTVDPDTGRPAACNGQLAYERLNQRLMLLCLSKDQKLLFAFCSEDKEFEFYQPATQTVYTGSIFDLEDALDLRTSIKPLALYRALKVQAVPASSTRIEYQDSEKFRLAVKSLRPGVRGIQRKLEIAVVGDLLVENYFGPDGKETLRIERSDYEIHKKQGLYRQETYTFPKRIKITDRSKNGAAGETMLTFSRFDFTPVLASNSWTIPLPPGTRRVNVSETFESLEKRTAN